MNFVDVYWALNTASLKQVRVEDLSRLTIDRLKGQGKLVALVLLNEKVKDPLKYLLPKQIEADVFNALLTNCPEHAPVVNRFYKVSKERPPAYFVKYNFTQGRLNSINIFS